MIGMKMMTTHGRMNKMAKYKPKRVEPTYEQGERGFAQVRIKNKKIYIKFRETGNVHKFPRTKSFRKLTPGKWNIRLNGDETEIYSFAPISGNFRGKVSSFVGGDDGPQPKTKYVDFVRKDGKHIKYDYDYFTVLVEITEPEKLAGVEVPLVMRYNFLEAKEDEESVVGLMSKGSRTKELEEFLDLVGAWNRGPMEWSDNILPDLEKRILRADQPFMFLMKEGWIDTLYAADEPEESEDWEEESDEVKEPEPVPDDDKEEEIDWE